MSESRAVPSGKVYRQLFDAQVQLSRSLLAGRRDMRTDCLSAEDCNTHCSTTSRGQQVDDDDVDDVTKLPDAVVASCPSSDIINHLTQEKHKKHKEALKHLDTELTEVTQVCETHVRTLSREGLSSLQDVDLKLDTLKDRMEQLEHLDHVSLQDVCGLWQQVKNEVNLKKMKIQDLNHKLTECETQRINKIRAVLRKHCHLLEKISFLLPADVHRLIHAEATMLNQALLANRRSVARLRLLLQEENLQQESLLRLHWEDCLSRWRRSRVTEVIDRFRSLCSSAQDQQLISVQQMKQTQLDLTEERHDLICRICSLVPPTCSTALVSDWFNQLTVVNQQIDSLHADLIHQLRCGYEQLWRVRLAEVEHCQEALSALQLSEEEVDDVISSQLLTLIGRSQRLDEERLAALDVCSDSAARRALSLSRHVFVMMRGAALLWETHSCRLKRREEEVQQHLDDLRRSQHRNIQRKKVRLDDLMGVLRQESSEDALKTSLDKTVLYLQDVKQSCRQCVSEQWTVLDRLPSVALEELLSYSSSLSSFYQLSHTYNLSPQELENLHLLTTKSSSLETSLEAEKQKPEEMTDNCPMSCQNDVGPTQPSGDWLTEASSSLLYLCDISSNVMFTSARGVAYTGPTFRCPAPDLPENLEQESQLNLFPVELLTHALSRTRTLFIDHLEQHFHDVLSSAVAMVTDRKKAVCLEQEFKLQQLNPQDIHTHIYQPRLVELQVHQQCMDRHCQEVLDVLTSCRTQLQVLQSTISRKNLEFTTALSKMEDDVLTANSSLRLDALSSALQDRLDQHIKHTQSCQTTFRQTVQVRLEQVRHTTTQLLNSFRLFSEGGDCFPTEVKLLKRRLTEQTRHISVTEETICCDLDAFESQSLQQVREVLGRLEEKLSLLKSELEFMEKIQREISSTQVLIRAEAAYSNQQQSVISSRLEEVRMMMMNREVCPDQVCSFLSSVIKDLKSRCQYLEFDLKDLGLSDHPRCSKEVQSGPPPGLLEPSRIGADLLDDPVVGVVTSLNRFCMIQDGSTGAAGKEERGRTSAGQSPDQQPQRRLTESVSAQRGGCRSIRADRRFQIFGSKPETEQNTHSFRSTVDSVLWRTNDILLQRAEDFYCSELLTRFQLLPDTVDQWVENKQQRLLGYQDQALRFLSTSRKSLVYQLSLFEDLLPSLISALFSNYERQKGVELREVAGEVRKKLEETVAASEQEKTGTVCQLRVSLGADKLQTLINREELRQQQLHAAICRSHLELQECVRIQGEEFVTSLASLTEKLFCVLDDLLEPSETEAASHLHAVYNNVALETGAGMKPCGRRRCILGHLTVIEQRDTAVKQFEQMFRLELLRSDDDKRKQLRELHSWNTHWRQQINTLRHTQ